MPAKSKPEFVDKPYYPFLLGNGVDSVLVDYSGSMGCDSGHLHTEQHQGTPCAWYKCGYHNRRRITPPILQATYTLLANGGEAYEVGEFTQRFDPKTAVLTTDVEATDFRLRIEAFLTDTQILVERYTVRKAPADRAEIALNLHEPAIPGSQLIYDWRYKQSTSLRADKAKGRISGSYRLDGVAGRAAMYVDAPVGRVGTFRDSPQLILENVRAGFAFTRYLIVLDETDTPAYEKETASRLRFAQREGYKAIRAAHERVWRKYHARSAVKLPRSEFNDLYSLGLYLIRAHRHPATGLISIGNLPNLWGGGVSDSWDLTFAYEALIGANRVEETRRLIEGYDQAMPHARRYARQLKARGAYFPWFADFRGRSLCFDRAGDCPDIEKFNNGCLVMQAFGLYRHTGDIEVLRRHWRMMKDIADFLVDRVVEEHGDAAYIVTGQGADESIHRRNCSLHAITTIKALEAVAEAADILGRKTDGRYERLAAKLRKGLRENIRGKLLMPFRDATQITSQVFTNFVLHWPDRLPAENVRRGLKLCQGAWGLTNPGTYRNLVWPWSEFQAAVALAYCKDRRAGEHILHGAKFTTTSGAFPEKIRPDGHWINLWFLDAHACFVWAVNAALVHTRGNELRLLAGAPNEWRDLECENLRVEPGVLVSLQLRKGKLTKLALLNDSPKDVQLKLDIPTRVLSASNRSLRGYTVTLPAGRIWRAPSR
jgi:hypothetical protein